MDRHARLRSRSLIIAIMLVIGLAACGKKGPPEPPEDEPLTYPRTYPTR
ncbi:MAG: lipoprotein [Alphaproteobacteria bacterium]|jgi:predicted small lipoprotein YifL